MVDFSRHVFRAYDIRGIANTELTPWLTFNIGRALAHFWKDGPKNVTLGCDARVSSPEMCLHLALGFRNEGWACDYVGIVPTPVVYFATVSTEIRYGVMVTGSHNPPEYNGFKMSKQGGSLSASDIQNLKMWIAAHGKEFPESHFILEKSDISKKYIRKLLEDYRTHTSPSKKNLKIVIDSGSGAAGPISTELFRSTGHEIIPLYNVPDGTFPFHHPDPSVEKNLSDLKKAVHKHSADLGIAFDGDGDRIGVVCSDGSIMPGDLLLTLFAKDILKDQPGASIISEVKATQVFYDEIARLGGRAVMSATGHSIIKARIRSESAALAGELSGHIFFADRYYGFDDALYSALRLILWTEKPENSLLSFLASLPKVFNSPEIRKTCPDHLKFQVVESVAATFKKTHEVSTVDGARISFGAGGWGLVRASNTQPELVLRYEARELEQLKTIETTINRVLNPLLM